MSAPIHLILNAKRHILHSALIYSVVLVVVIISLLVSSGARFLLVEPTSASGILTRTVSAEGTKFTDIVAYCCC